MRSAPAVELPGKRPGVLSRWLLGSAQRRLDVAPVVLRHYRVYVLPTARGWVLLLTLLLMLVTSMNYALSLGYALTFLIAGLVGSSLIHVSRNMIGVQIEPSGRPRAFAGDPLSYSFRVTNLARFPRRMLTLRSGKSSTTIRELAPGGSTTAVVAIPTTRRGRLRFGRFSLESDFPLGLWRAWALLRFGYEGIVYPRPESSPPPLQLAGDNVVPPQARRLAQLSVDAELDGLREYRPGDPQRSIAWKAVARGTGWYSKHYAGQTGSGWAVLRWADTTGAPDDEKRLSRLAAWAVRAERNCLPFLLELPDRGIALGQGAAHLDEVLTALALFRPAETPQ